MSIKLGYCVLGVCFLALLANDSATGSQQKITFFEQAGCPGTGWNHTIYNTDTNLRNHQATNALSTRIWGVWKITPHNATNSGSIIAPRFFGSTNPPEGRCINKSAWNLTGWQNYAIHTATRFGPADMTTSQLILYPDREFIGVPYLVTNDWNNNNSAPIRSYIHFSNETWTLFSGTQFNGTTTILSPTSETVPDNFAYKTSVNYVVGSVRKGRHTSPTTTTTESSNVTTNKNGGEKRSVFTIMMISLLFAASILN